MKSLIFVLATIVACTTAQYCNLDSCNGKPHTMCYYPDTKNKCQRPISSGLTQDEMNRIVNMHNKLRQRVARGEETRGASGPQPAATKMEMLKWDKEIAEIAQHWANQCHYGHDKCRNTPKEYVGQNIAIKGTTGNMDHIKVENLVQMWYDEVDYFYGQWISEPFVPRNGSYNKVIGHYTQFVWGETNKIGCGAIKYRDEEGFNNLYLVCNYGPGGNHEDEMIYQTKDNQSFRSNRLRPSTNRSNHQIRNSPTSKILSTSSYTFNGKKVSKEEFEKLTKSHGSSNYVSHYTINGKPVSKEEYLKLTG